MGPHSKQPGTTVHGEFAETVQTLPPADLPDMAMRDGSSASESLPGADSDIGLDIAAESANVAEQPTLSHIGRYALKSLLGEGGLGRVYEAWDPLLSRTVAVKTLQFDLDMPSRIALDRLLLNEARAAGSLNHPNIVTVHDAGLSAHGVYIAMERLRGRDLRQALAEGWRPTPGAAAQIVRRVADALAYAHAKGVVHCDIKPGNIFLARKDKPKVLDFGIARAAHASALPASDGTVAGSPYYLAPEQLQGGTVDARTDIYALGVVLYELLTGRKAFGGDSLEKIHADVLTGSPPSAHTLRPDVPEALSTLVASAMDRDPQRRPASAAELSQALREFPQAAPASEATPPPVAGDAKPKPWFVLVAGVVVLAAVAWAVLPASRDVSVDAALTQTTTPAPVVTPALLADTAAPTPPPEVPAAASAPTVSAAADVPAPALTPKPARPGPPRQKPAAAVVLAPVAPPAIVTGSVQIAISPWGQIEVNGNASGTTPPLTTLTLPEGNHTITVRNADFPPYTTTVQVTADKPAVVRHRFGS